MKGEKGKGWVLYWERGRWAPKWWEEKAGVGSTWGKVGNGDKKAVRAVGGMRI